MYSIQMHNGCFENAWQEQCSSALLRHDHHVAAKRNVASVGL